MALQNAVVTTNPQQNALEQGGVRTYSGRVDIRRCGDRPQYSGSVSLVATVEGNRVKDSSGKVHSMTITKPVPADSKSTTTNVRLQGSSQTEDRKRDESKQYAQALNTIAIENGTMYTSVAVAELREPAFKPRIKFGAFAKLFPDLFTMQTATAGGAMTRPGPFSAAAANAEAKLALSPFQAPVAFSALKSKAASSSTLRSSVSLNT